MQLFYTCVQRCTALTSAMLFCTTVTLAAPTPDMTKLTASDASANDDFGTTSVIDDDIAVVYALGITSIYIFEKDYGGTDNWGQRKKIIPSDLSVSSLGSNMAIDADTLAIGSTSKIFILERDQGGTDNWGLTTSISNTTNSPFALVGDTLAVRKDHNTVAIHYRDQGGTDNWGEVTTVDSDSPDEFAGSDVALSADEDTLVVSDPQYDSVPNVVVNVGKIYVFGRNEGGTDNWGQLATFTADTPVQSDKLGKSIAIHEDVIATVTSPNTSVPLEIFLFERDPSDDTVWTEIKVLTATNSVFDTSSTNGAVLDFSDDGSSLFYGNRAAYELTSTDPQTGAVFQFSKDAGGVNNWGEVARIVTCDNDANDGYGNTVSVSGGYMIAGAPDDDDDGTSSGTAYISEYAEHGLLGIPSDVVAITGNETELATNTVRNEGSYIVGTTGDVTWRAGYKIIIKPGFEVQTGGEFDGIVEPIGCDDI